MARAGRGEMFRQFVHCGTWRNVSPVRPVLAYQRCSRANTAERWFGERWFGSLMSIEPKTHCFMSTLFMGLDLGQARDYTALAIIEKVVPPPMPADDDAGDVPFYEKTQENTKAADPHFHVRYLERFPLGTPYPDVVRRVSEGKKELETTSGSSVPLIVDATGVGVPVVDLFKEAKLRPIAVWIHGGETVSQEGRTYRVPKRDLAGVLQVLFQSGRIKVARSLREAETLMRELAQFRVKISIQTGHDSYEAWREGDHDDLVLAVALACWYGVKKRGKHVVFTASTREIARVTSAYMGMGRPGGRLDLRGY